MMRAPARWLWHGLIALATGLVWFSAGFGMGAGSLGLALAIIPGSFLVATGTALFFWSGDLRIPQFMALSAIVGVILAIPGMIVYTVGLGFLLLFLSVASYLAAGYAVMRQETLPEQVPAMQQGPATAAKLALDDALLAYFISTAKIPRGERTAALVDETGAWLDLIQARGWHDKPETFHRAPPVLESPRMEPRRFARWNYELLTFESGYTPDMDQPGAGRWQSYSRNRTAYARVLRHPGEPRPWLIGIHGYRMGVPALDFPLFQPHWLHEKLGLNLLLPILPLHGQRKAGWRTGDGFLEGELPDMVNAEAQAIWDIRRMLTWLRQSENAQKVGLLGYSLGGYNTALLGCLEPDLACLIAGIPAVDLVQLLWRHMPPDQTRYLQSRGVGLAQARESMHVVSPLAMPCLVPREKRFIFGGVADRLVPPEEVLRLHEHWQQPRLEWYQGAHLTFRGQGGVSRVIHEGLEAGGLLG